MKFISNIKNNDYEESIVYLVLALVAVQFAFAGDVITQDAKHFR